MSQQNEVHKTNPVQGGWNCVIYIYIYIACIQQYETWVWRDDEPPVYGYWTMMIKLAGILDSLVYPSFKETKLFLGGRMCFCWRAHFCGDKPWQQLVGCFVWAWMKLSYTWVPTWLLVIRKGSGILTMAFCQTCWGRIVMTRTMHLTRKAACPRVEPHQKAIELIFLSHTSACGTVVDEPCIECQQLIRKIMAEVKQPQVKQPWFRNTLTRIQTRSPT